MSDMGNETVKLEDYVTANEAAKIASLTSRRIRQLASLEDIKGKKIAGRWFINRDSLYRYLSQRG